MYCDIPDFGRCCFCLPLRRGVLVFGYINVLFSAFMVGVYSYFVHYDQNLLIFRGVLSHNTPGAFCIAIYCIEILINCLLVYGAHVKNIKLLKVFYYYTITTILAALIMQIVEFTSYLHEPEMITLTFTWMCIQMYLIFLVRSLLKKLEQGSSHTYDNQLHTIVLGEPVGNGVYNNTTVTPLREDY